MFLMETNEIFKTQLSQNQHQLTDEEIEAIKNIVLEIACDVIAVCERERIPYMLGGGSALGAIRHQGFIPWDEDIDINVPRKYVHRLCDLIREEFPEKYNIDEPVYTDGYLSSFIQIHKKGTVFQEYLVQDIEKCGVKIDIFPIENTYSNKILRVLHGIQCEMGLLILSCYRMFAWRREMLALAKGNLKARFMICVKGAIGIVFVPWHKWWYRRIQLSFQKCRDDTTGWVTIPSGRKHFFGELYERNSYLETIGVAFEGHLFQVTKDYDKYLTNLYGDYKKIPPLEKQEHHVIYRLKL